jgi:predicted GH43/DUF377 family glycosyl hydrolase
LPDTSVFQRQQLYLRPDPARVIVRPFRPTTEPRDLQPTDRRRANHIVERVLALSESAAAAELCDVLDNFETRHRDLVQTLDQRAAEMDQAFADHPTFSRLQRQLVGAYFLQEYSYEASALFNPSIVPHPDPSGTTDGAIRVILSLRAVGEGHVSSMTFRSGQIGRDGRMSLDPGARLAGLPEVFHNLESGADTDDVTLRFNPLWDLSERVIFPVTLRQSNGVEDARFVAFDHGDRVVYYATYTAYDGRSIRSELLETTDFVTFRMRPMTGAACLNKGMALFPRRLNGQFAMIGRQDNENLHLIYSDDLTRWEQGTPFLSPEYPWEFVQIGNCGSPIELDEGWLLFTHGVGALRKYAIGAVLLDRNDPSRVIARSAMPLIRPDPAEREGYVPNVVYTCGALRHGDRIILPFAVSDTFTNFASASIRELLDSLTPVTGRA